MALRHDFIFLVVRYTFCVLLFASVLFIARPSFSDTGGWATTYGGRGDDCANSIQQTNDGGYIVAGDTTSFGAKEGGVWVLKLGPDGFIEWQRAYQAGIGIGHSIQQTNDGGYILAGSTMSFGAGDADFWVLKLRADGAVEWQKTYGGANRDIAYCICQTTDGGYIVAGGTKSFGAGGEDFWILKLWAYGTVEWQKTYGGDGLDRAVYIQQDRDGGYIVAGTTSSFGAGEEDLWVLKLRSDGTVEWQKTFGEYGIDLAYSLLQTGDGGYILAGLLGTPVVGGTLIMKLKPDGTVEWQKTYGFAFVHAIQQTYDGGFILAGWAEASVADRRNFWVSKLRADGTAEWQKMYGGYEWDLAYSVQQTGDGGYIVAGETKSFGARGKDLLVLKLRVDGSIGPSCNFIIRDTGTGWKDSSATAGTTEVNPEESAANPQNSHAMTWITNVLTNFLCTPR